VALVALIHTAAVGMTYLLGARFFGRRVGLIAMALFAVNPWAIYYARKMWTQNWPLATTLFFYCLLLLVVERRPRALAGAGLALIPLAGTHLGGLAFIAVLAFVLLLFPSRVQRRPLLTGALVFLLFALPYLYHDATHDWSSLRGLLNPGDGPAQIDLGAARFAAWLSSGYHYEDLSGARHLQFLDGLPGLHWLDVLEMALLGLGLVYLIARVARHAQGGRERWKQHAGRDVVLLSWLLTPVLLQTRHTQPVYPHYFILLYPVQHLIIALLLSDGLVWLHRRLDRRWERWCTAGLLILILAIGGWQVYLGQTFTRFVARHDTPDGYGPVLGPLWRTTSAAHNAASVDGAEILVIAQGDNPTWDNLPSAFDVLLPRHVSHRFVSDPKALVYPMRPTVYIIAPEAAQALAALQTQPEAVLWKDINAPGDKHFWVFRRSNESRDDVLAGMTRLDPPLRLANGVELLAYGLGDDSMAGGTVHLCLAWWLYDDSRLPAETDYHAFAHLVDGDGRRWGQHDLLSFPSASWRAGDVVLTRFQIETDAETPPGDYWINLGMYSYPDVIAAPVLDVAGNPASDFTVVGPIELRR